MFISTCWSVRQLAFVIFIFYSMHNPILGILKAWNSRLPLNVSLIFISTLWKANGNYYLMKSLVCRPVAWSEICTFSLCVSLTLTDILQPAGWGAVLEENSGYLIGLYSMSSSKKRTMWDKTEEQKLEETHARPELDRPGRRHDGFLCSVCKALLKKGPHWSILIHLDKIPLEM